MIDVQTRAEYVLKRCNVDRKESLAIVEKERKMLQTFEGPYVVKLYGSDFCDNSRGTRDAVLLLEFCPGGHLLQRLNERNGTFLPMEHVYRIFGQILMGLKAFHEHEPPVINRDLKLENVLFGAVSVDLVMVLFQIADVSLIRTIRSDFVTLDLALLGTRILETPERGKK